MIVNTAPDLRASFIYVRVYASDRVVPASASLY
jgi:hypothetical protein